MVEHLEDVPHAFVKVELDGDAGVIECLVVPDCIAQEDFLRSNLDQRGWETLRVNEQLAAVLPPFGFDVENRNASHLALLNARLVLLNHV